MSSTLFNFHLTRALGNLGDNFHEARCGSEHCVDKKLVHIQHMLDWRPNSNVPQYILDIWSRVTLWVRIPSKKRTVQEIQTLVQDSLECEGFSVHSVEVDFNASQDKYYVRPVVSGTCESTKACVERLSNGRAGEVRLETDLFVWQRDNTTNEPLFNRSQSTRYRIRPLRQTCHKDDSRDRTDTLYRVVVLQPGDDATSNRSKTIPPHPQKSSHSHMGTRRSRALQIRRKSRSRTLRRIHSAVQENTQDTKTSSTVEDLGFTTVRRRKIRTAKTQTSYHRFATRHKILPLCRGGRLVSPVC